MSTSWINFLGSLKDKWVGCDLESSDQTRRLEDFLRSDHVEIGDQLTLDCLVDLLGGSSREEIALILAKYVRDGKLSLVYRVESEVGKGGIKDFKTIDEIPTQIHDWRTDQEVEVTAENLKVLYKVPA